MSRDARDGRVSTDPSLAVTVADSGAEHTLTALR